MTRTDRSLFARWPLAACVGVVALTGCEGRDPLALEPLNVEFSFGEVGERPGEFNYPRGMCVAPGGDAGIDGPTLIVVDKTARIQRFNAQTGEVVGWVRTPEWTLGKPTGMKVGPHPADPGHQVLYVADTHYHRVLIYDLPRGEGPEEGGTEPLLTFGAYGTEPGGFVYPTDVALWTDASGAVERVYVSEYGGNDRVTIFEPIVQGDDVRFEVVRTFGHFGTPGVDDPGDGVLMNRPQQLVADIDRGELLVADAINHRIGRFTPEGELIKWIGAAEGQIGEGGLLVYPYSLDVLSDGSILVSEFGGGRVTRLDRETGAVLGRFGTPGRDAGQLAQPWEVAVAGRTAWVLDSGNHRVVSFRSPVEGAITAGDGSAAQ